MAKDTQTVQYGDANICTMTFIVFLVLKLCGTITWSWWWITAPLWIPSGIVLILLAVIGILTGFVILFDKR